MTLLALHAIANNNGGLNAAEQPLKTGGSQERAACGFPRLKMMPPAVAAVIVSTAPQWFK